MKYYILIRGPAAVGKSTIVKKLADSIKAHHISFDELMRKSELDTFVGEGIPTENFVKANQMIIPKVKEKLKKNIPVVLDGCFYRKEQLKHLLKNLQYKHFIFSLEASLKDCIARNKTRESPMTDKAIKDVYRLVAKIKVGIRIKTSGRNVKEIIQEIINHLDKKGLV